MKSSEPHSPSQSGGLVVLGVLVTMAVAVMALRLFGLATHGPLDALVFGAGIIACAFVMGTAAELVQLEVSRSLAVILVALLAVLPEYAVDIYFAWAAGKDPSYASYALANMTGANRLLIGLGWTFIAFLWWRRTRRSFIELDPSNGGEIFFLALATAWSFAIPFKRSLSLLDTAVLFLLFFFYLRFATRQPRGEPELVGPAEVIARAPRGRRRMITLGLFLAAGGGIFASSEPFAEGLLASGGVLGISEYHLVQWLAPLASETPEFLVASLLVWRLQPTAGFGTLLSSKLNQWTLLVGAVPVAYYISSAVHGREVGPLHIDSRQTGEVLLTAAQSYLGVCVLLNRRFQLSEAALLVVLFAAQLGLSIFLEEFHPEWLWHEKTSFSILYMVAGTAYLVTYRKHLRSLKNIAFAR